MPTLQKFFQAMKHARFYGYGMKWLREVMEVVSAAQADTVSKHENAEVSSYAYVMRELQTLLTVSDQRYAVWVQSIKESNLLIEGLKKYLRNDVVATEFIGNIEACMIHEHVDGSTTVGLLQVLTNLTLQYKGYPAQINTNTAPKIGGQIRPTSPICSADSLGFWGFADLFCRFVGVSGVLPICSADSLGFWGFADLFCRFVGVSGVLPICFADSLGFWGFADLFCRFVGVSGVLPICSADSLGFWGFADLFCRFVGVSGVLPICFADSWVSGILGHPMRRGDCAFGRWCVLSLLLLLGAC